MAEENEGFNHSLNVAFDILTYGSPLRSEAVRDAIRPIGMALIASKEPISASIGAGIMAGIQIHDLRRKKRKK